MEDILSHLHQVHTFTPFFKVLNVSKVVPVLLTEHHAMKAYWSSEGIAPRILDLDTKWR